MFLEGIFRELLNISLTENNLQLLTVDLRAYLFSQVKLLLTNEGIEVMAVT